MIKLLITQTYWIKEENLSLHNSVTGETKKFSEIENYREDDWQLVSMADVEKSSEMATIDNFIVRQFNESLENA